MKRSTTLTTLALASALALAGCGTSGAQEGAGTDAETAAPAASASAATSTGAASGEPIAAEHNDADVMFAQMMLPHHEQAVEMSEMLLAKDDVPAEVAEFAQRVIDAQGPEIERMNDMLTAWEAEPLADAEDMDGMDHGSGAGMSGMMSEEDMSALEDAQGTGAAQLYLEQMTVHHEGAVEMAQEQIEQGQNPQAVELARQVVADQEAEIAEMEQMLQELPDGS
ncbi:MULTISPECIES: DUF305 domain-containing protein [Kocuria]|uniref:DUF305 domain-containing protein n=1 Tax=Kocuria TaxID=57493 RepID=UPI000D64ECEB|nr:DUF305 domain-containing protein [Kocuria rosea]MCM3486580.1 DUF305 domain-containing protein [Kocuria rosea]PWF79779.1 DUF305 domain-containing protein [Kocuria rosea]PWF79803.1 DUF305 domain-containing protein [Kocuria rosea]STX03613.1 Uncharacterized protein conserved in bacteria [Kocuria rosea]